MTHPIDNRYNKFLSTYDFYTNSIDFRIHSSSALEKWKNVQAFQLNQLVNGRFFFAADRREVILLKYDLWSRWLYEIENLCIELTEDDRQVNSDDIDTIIDLADKTTEIYKNIIRNEFSTYFDTKFTSMWLEQHEHVYNYMVKKIKSLNGCSFVFTFTSIVDILCDVMQYTLVEIYELDNVILKMNVDPTDNDCVPFVVISNLSERVFQEYDICLVCERIKVLKKYFEFDTVYLKNYTDEDISLGLINCIENTGVSIDYRKSITKD